MKNTINQNDYLNMGLQGTESQLNDFIYAQNESKYNIITSFDSCSRLITRSNPAKEQDNLISGRDYTDSLKSDYQQLVTPSKAQPNPAWSYLTFTFNLSQQAGLKEMRIDELETICEQSH